MAGPQLRLNVAPGNEKTGTKENNNKRLFRGKLQTLVRSFFLLLFWSPGLQLPQQREKRKETSCTKRAASRSTATGQSSRCPRWRWSRQVSVGESSATPTPTPPLRLTAPTMPSDANIDWLLHIYFTRREFERCRRLIERELNRHLNAEYLYFVKVSEFSNRLRIRFLLMMAGNSTLYICGRQGLIEREDGNNIEALRNLQRAVELNSRNIETYKEIGRTL